MQANHPAQSATILHLIPPANRDKITFTSYTDSERLPIAYGSDSDKSGTGTQRNLFSYGEADGMGGHPTQPKLARLQNPDTPLYLHKLLKCLVNMWM